jgi:ACDE family multidrug resistance protein
VARHLARLAASGITATAQIIESVGDHAAAGRAVARHATEAGATLIAIGHSPRGAVAQFTDGSFTSALNHAATTSVVLVSPASEPRPLTPESIAELRAR